MKENIKYKVSELAKDLNVTNNDIIKLLSEKFEGTKKAVTALTAYEITYVLEYYTQNNQVKSFDEYFAATAVKEEKKEAVKEEKPAKTVKAEKTEKKPAKTEKVDAKKPAVAKPAAEPKKAEPAVKEAVNNNDRRNDKKKEKQLPKKKDIKMKQQLVSNVKTEAGYTVVKEETDNKRHIDTRGSYVELDKYNEKYDNLAGTARGKNKDNYSKKQKLTMVPL